MTVANLRGLRESGALFAPPTYLYIVMLGVLHRRRPVPRVLPGPRRRSRYPTSSEEAQSSPRARRRSACSCFLKAFSSGAVALSGRRGGVERRADVPQPESRNAATTLAMMGSILGVGFFGISVLASHLQPYRGEDDPTGIALMAEHVFGGRNILFWVIQFATFAILILAANTAYAGFPALSSIIARDGYLPRQIANRGDRLVFSNGIMFLAAAAGVLIIAFDGNITALIPLYAVGVFTGFTLSQTGMVVHHFRDREPRWRSAPRSTAIGAVTTGVVAIVVVVSKFSKGAWIPAVLIPLMVVIFKAIHRHYRTVSARCGSSPATSRSATRTPSSMLVGTRAPGRARRRPVRPQLAPDRLFAVSVVTGPEEQEAARRSMGAVRHPDPGAHDPVAVPRAHRPGPATTSTSSTPTAPTTSSPSIIPEFVTQWKTQWLHNQSAFALKARLLYRPNTVVTSVPVLVGTEHDRVAPAEE